MSKITNEGYEMNSGKMSGIKLRAKEYIKLLQAIDSDPYYNRKLIEKIVWSEEDEVNVYFYTNRSQASNEVTFYVSNL